MSGQFQWAEGLPLIFSDPAPGAWIFIACCVFLSVTSIASWSRDAARLGNARKNLKPVTPVEIKDAEIL
jgi:hypothetical protein